MKPPWEDFAETAAPKQEQGPWQDFAPKPDESGPWQDFAAPEQPKIDTTAHTYVPATEAAPHKPGDEPYEQAFREWQARNRQTMLDPAQIKRAGETLADPKTYGNAVKGIGSFLLGLAGAPLHAIAGKSANVMSGVLDTVGADKLAEKAMQEGLRHKAEATLAGQTVEEGLKSTVGTIADLAGRRKLERDIAFGSWTPDTPEAKAERAYQEEQADRQDFEEAVEAARRQQQLASGRPLDTGAVARLARISESPLSLGEDALPPSQALGPEALAFVGAKPVRPLVVEGIAAAADPRNLALAKAGTFPGAEKVGAAITKGAGKVMQAPAAVISKVPGRVGRIGGDIAKGAIGLGAAYEAVQNPEAAAAIAGLVAGAKGMSWLGRGMELQAGAKLASLRAGKIVPSALDESAAVGRITGQGAKAAAAQRMAGNAATEAAANLVGNIPYGVVESGGDAQHFVASEINAAAFGGALGALHNQRAVVTEAAIPYLVSRGEQSLDANTAVGRRSAEYLNTLPEDHRRNALALMGALAQMQTESGTGGQMYVLDGDAYQQVVASLGGGAAGGGRGFFRAADGTAYINGDSKSFEHAPEALHTMGHEFGGHAVMSILRAASERGGSLYERLVGEAKRQLLNPDGTPTSEFNQFIETYNRRFDPTGAHREIDARDPNAIEEWIAEQAGQQIAGRGVGDIAVPDNISDKITQGLGRALYGLLGIDTREVGTPTKFNRQEIGNLSALVRDTLQQVAGMKFRGGAEMPVPEQTRRERIDELNEAIRRPRPAPDAPAEAHHEWQREQKEAAQELKALRESDATPESEPVVPTPEAESLSKTQTYARDMLVRNGWSQKRATAHVATFPPESGIDDMLAAAKVRRTSSSSSATGTASKAEATRQAAQMRKDATAALVALGYSEGKARNRIAKATQQHAQPFAAVEDMVLAARRIEAGGIVKPGEFTPEAKAAREAVKTTILPEAPVGAEIRLPDGSTVVVTGERADAPQVGDLVVTAAGDKRRVARVNEDGSIDVVFPATSTVSGAVPVPDGRYRVLATEPKAAPAPEAEGAKPALRAEPVGNLGNWQVIDAAGAPVGNRTYPDRQSAERAIAMRQSGRKPTLPPNPAGSPDIIDVIMALGGIRPRNEAPESGRDQYDDQPDVTKRGVYAAITQGAEAADSMATRLAEGDPENGIPAFGDGFTSTMWRLIGEAVEARQAFRAQERKGRQAEGQAARQARTFQRDAIQNPDGTVKVETQTLAVGDTVTVAGEKLTVTHLDPDTLAVTLEDGAKYGTQTLPDGQTLYVEDVQRVSREEAAEDPFAIDTTPDETPAPPQENERMAVGTATAEQEPVDRPATPSARTLRTQDFERIAAQAEATTKAGRTARQKAHTLPEAVRLARLRAVIEAHAENTPLNHEGLRLRRDAYGHEEVTGKLDPSRDFDAWLLREAGIEPGSDTERIALDLQDRVGQATVITYRHAPGAGQGKASRTAAQTKASARARKAGEVEGKAFRKTVVPLTVKFTLGSSTGEAAIHVFAASPEKLLANWKAATEAMQQIGETAPYRSIDDPAFEQDIALVQQNHQNGWKGDGSEPIKSEAFPEARIEPTEGYRPDRVLDQAKFEFINLLLGTEQAKGKTQKARDIRARAAENQTLVTPEGETNELRDRINRALGRVPKLDENGEVVLTPDGEVVTDTWSKVHIEDPLNELVRPDLMLDVPTEPTADDASIRPSGSTLDPGRFFREGKTPSREFSAAGFMPETETPTLKSDAVRQSAFFRKLLRSTGYGRLEDVPMDTLKKWSEQWRQANPRERQDGSLHFMPSDIPARAKEIRAQYGTPKEKISDAALVWLHDMTWKMGSPDEKKLDDATARELAQFVPDNPIRLYRSERADFDPKYHYHSWTTDKGMAAVMADDSNSDLVTAIVDPKDIVVDMNRVKAHLGKTDPELLDEVIVRNSAKIDKHKLSIDDSLPDYAKPEPKARFMPEEGIGGYADPRFDIPEKQQERIAGLASRRVRRAFPELDEQTDDFRIKVEKLITELSNEWAHKHPRDAAGFTPHVFKDENGHWEVRVGTAPNDVLWIGASSRADAEAELARHNRAISNRPLARIAVTGEQVPERVGSDTSYTIFPVNRRPGIRRTPTSLEMIDHEGATVARLQPSLTDEEAWRVFAQDFRAIAPPPEQPRRYSVAPARVGTGFNVVDAEGRPVTGEVLTEAQAREEASERNAGSPATAESGRREQNPDKLPTGWSIQRLRTDSPVGNWTMIGPDGTGNTFSAPTREAALEFAREQLSDPDSPLHRTPTRPNYKARPGTGRDWNVVNTQTGEVHDTWGTEQVARQEAVRLNQTAANQRGTPGLEHERLTLDDIETEYVRNGLYRAFYRGNMVAEAQGHGEAQRRGRDNAERWLRDMTPEERRRAMAPTQARSSTPRLTEDQINAQWEQVIDNARRELGPRQGLDQSIRTAWGTINNEIIPNYEQFGRLGEIIREAQEGTVAAVQDRIARIDAIERRSGTSDDIQMERMRLGDVRDRLERKARSSMPRLPKPERPLAPESPLADIHTELDGKIAEQQAGIEREISALTEQIDDYAKGEQVENRAQRAELEEFRRSLVEDHANLHNLREGLRLANPQTLEQFPRAFAEIRRLEVRGLISHEAKERAYDALSDRQNAEIARQIIAQEDARPARERQGRIDAKIRVAQREAAEQRTQQQTLWDELLTAKAQKALPKLARLWRQVSRSDNAFAYGRTKATDPADIAKDMSTPGHEITGRSDGSYQIQFRSANGTISISDINGRPEISAPGAGSRGKKEGGGAQLYQAAFAWAHNNGKVIHPSNALSAINAYVRRTSNMLSSALRFGTTRHMIPDNAQGVANWQQARPSQTKYVLRFTENAPGASKGDAFGIDGDPENPMFFDNYDAAVRYAKDYGLSDSVEPKAEIQRGVSAQEAADANNIAQLALRESEQVMKAVPELQSLDFDFKTGKIRDREGKEVTPAQIGSMLAAIGKEKTYERGIGLSTAQRAIITASAIREAEGGALARADRGRGVRVLKEQGKLLYMPEDADAIRKESRGELLARLGDKTLAREPKRALVGLAIRHGGGGASEMTESEFLASHYFHQADPSGVHGTTPEALLRGMERGWVMPALAKGAIPNTMTGRYASRAGQTVVAVPLDQVINRFASAPVKVKPGFKPRPQDIAILRAEDISKARFPSGVEIDVADMHAAFSRREGRSSFMPEEHEVAPRAYVQTIRLLNKHGEPTGNTARLEAMATSQDEAEKAIRASERYKKLGLRFRLDPLTPVPKDMTEKEKAAADKGVESMRQFKEMLAKGAATQADSAAVFRQEDLEITHKNGKRVKPSELKDQPGNG